MGRPFDVPNSPLANATSSSGSDDEGGWVQHDSDAESWQDPSGGALTRAFEAAEAGDVAALEQAIAGLDISIDTRGEDSDTALHLAALYGHTDCVRVLLGAGARADVPDSNGGLPLHDAASGGYLDIVVMLLDAAPGTLDRGDAEGDTPLHNAARGQHAEVVQLLLERGANFNLQNDDLKTPVQLPDRGTPARQLLEEAERRAAAAAEGAAPQVAPPAAEVA